MNTLSLFYTLIGRMLRVVLLPLLAIVFFLGSAYAALAPDGAQSAILRLVASQLGSSSAVDPLLKELGFPPDTAAGVDWRDEANWPLERKLAVAYVQADAASTGQGELALRFLAVRLSVDIPELRSATPLASYFADVKKGEEAKFVAPKIVWPSAAKTVAAGLPPDAIKIVKSIATYVSGVPDGVFGLLRRCCDLDDSEILETLDKSATIEDLLAHALSRGDPALQSRYLSGMIDTVGIDNIAILDDPSIESFREEARALLFAPDLAARDAARETAARKMASILATTVLPSSSAAEQIVQASTKQYKTNRRGDGLPPDNGGPGDTTGGPDHSGPLGPGPSAPNSPSSGPQSEQSLSDLKYKHFLDQQYQSFSGGGGGMPSFSEAIVFEGGFGGIIFGAEVSSSADLQKPASLAWVPLNSGRGTFLVSFADGTSARTAPVTAEDGQAAARIVFGQEADGGGEGWASPQAIGLVSESGGGAFVCPVHSDDQCHGDAFLVHPAIVDYTLGQDAIFVDASKYFTFPGVRDKLAQQIADAGGDERSFQTWMDTPAGNYKFVDVPTEIFIDEHDVLRPRRVGEGADAYSEDLRRTAFLTMQGFSQTYTGNDFGGGEIKAAEVPFYALGRTLTDISPPFRHVNSFASLLDILRWAKVEGLTSVHGTIDARPLAVSAGTLTWHGDVYEAPDSINVAFGPDLSSVIVGNVLAEQQSATDDLKAASAPKLLVELDDAVDKARVAWLQSDAYIGAVIDLQSGAEPADWSTYTPPVSMKSRNELLDTLLDDPGKEEYAALSTQMDLAQRTSDEAERLVSSLRYALGVDQFTDDLSSIWPDNLDRAREIAAIGSAVEAKAREAAVASSSAKSKLDDFTETNLAGFDAWFTVQQRIDDYLSSIDY